MERFNQYGWVLAAMLAWWVPAHAAPPVPDETAHACAAAGVPATPATERSWDRLPQFAVEPGVAVTPAAAKAQGDPAAHREPASTAVAEAPATPAVGGGADPQVASGEPMPAAARALSVADTPPANQDAGRPAAGRDPSAVKAERLERARGGTDTIATTTARLGGTVASNSAVNVSTGSNMINAGSFASSTGLPVVIQNTGANVLIQNATVINLQLK